MSDRNDEQLRFPDDSVKFDDTRFRKPRPYRNCEHELCDQRAEHWHHNAPRQFFDDFDLWPRSWLCQMHHDEWHRRMNTGYRVWYGVDYAEDVICPSCGITFTSPGDPEHLNER